MEARDYNSSMKVCNTLFHTPDKFFREALARERPKKAPLGHKGSLWDADDIWKGIKHGQQKA